ncbi:MAG TPA: hypothetical protein VN175_02235 [Rhizomicrobium sp.]|nr:hypothetical protein [Rhizomicrobium sp.]
MAVATYLLQHSVPASTKAIEFGWLLPRHGKTWEDGEIKHHSCQSQQSRHGRKRPGHAATDASFLGVCDLENQ